MATHGNARPSRWRVSVGSRRVTRVLERIIAERGAWKALRCDNGPEFTSRHFLRGCQQRGITMVHIEPGRPMQNGYVESVHGRFLDEYLNANWFVNMVDAKEKIEWPWRVEYNGERPHSSLDYRTPAEFAQTCSELTSRMAATPPEPPVEWSGLHDGAREQGFAYAAQNRRALARCGPLCRSRCRDGRLRRDGLGTGRMTGLSKLRLVEKSGAGHPEPLERDGRLPA